MTPGMAGKSSTELRGPETRPQDNGFGRRTLARTASACAAVSQSGRPTTYTEDQPLKLILMVTPNIANKSPTRQKGPT